MDIHVISVGEWTNSLMSRMMNAGEGDLFCLPTAMHLHAYMLLKDTMFADREFKVEIKESAEA
jgi:hypothetical protein